MVQRPSATDNTEVSMTTLPLDDQQTQAASAHLNYEVKMMAAMYAWTVRFDQQGPALMKNACLESALIHMRLLIEFLAGRTSPTKADPLHRKWNSRDVRPAHFVSDWPGFPDKRLDGYLQMADEYLAHMSIARAQTIAGRGWALETMVDHILFEFANFADAVDRAGRSAVAITLRTGLTTAQYLKTNPPDSWPPEFSLPEVPEGH